MPWTPDLIVSMILLLLDRCFYFLISGSFQQERISLYVNANIKTGFHLLLQYYTIGDEVLILLFFFFLQKLQLFESLLMKVAQTLNKNNVL